MKEALHLPPGAIELPILGQAIDRGYFYGLLIFAATVVAYTTYGGFWAVAWTDVLEGTVKLLGVILMAVLAMAAVPAVDGMTGLTAATEHLRQQDPNLVLGPGPNNFLPLGMAFSFFLMWSLTTPGQPHSMVRLMSFRDTRSLSRSLLLVCVYYVITYGSLLVIFICARAIFPVEYLHGEGTLGEPDSIMPAMALKVAPPLIAGMLLAAPYAAIMSSVAAFLLMISSSLVRDIYQRTINPEVTPRVLKAASYFATALVGMCVLVVRAASSRLSAIHHRLHQHGVGLRFFDSDVDVALLAAGDRVWRSGGNGRGPLHSAAPLCRWLDRHVEPGRARSPPGQRLWAATRSGAVAARALEWLIGMGRAAADGARASLPGRRRYASLGILGFSDSWCWREFVHATGSEPG